MPEATFQFMTFRDTEEPREDSDLSSPPNLLADALEKEQVPFEMRVYRLPRAEAAAHPEAQDLYPEGPASGPDQVFLYHFITRQSHLPQALAVSEKLFP